jgi:hypothetical protein
MEIIGRGRNFGLVSTMSCAIELVGEISTLQDFGPSFLPNCNGIFVIG